jgi:anaerobic selenocysteine-containing dehydrogenase
MSAGRQRPPSPEIEKHFRTCNLCDAMCGMIATVEDGRVTDLRGDPDDVFSKGHICPKGPALRELHEDPDRLREPVRRTAKGWERISWDEALDEAATKLGDIRARHGRDGIGVYGGNPMAHNHGGALGMQALMGALGTHNRFDANSQDSNPKIFAAMQCYGDGLSLTVPDIDRTDYLLMLGANPAVSNGSVMTLGDVKNRLKGVRQRGGRMVLLDPRRTESAALCDEHHFLRPGGDAAFLLSFISVLFDEELIDARAVRRRAHGSRTLRTIAERFRPERVERAIGLDAAIIRRLAREVARARTAIVYGRIGPCLNEHGVVASWLLEAVNVLTGNFDRPGGMMFATPAVDLGPLARLLLGNEWGRFRSRVRKLPELAGSLPSAVIAEEMETPGEGRIRAFVTYAGNPVLSTPNGERLGRALANLEHMVSVDHYVNETTRHAHLILPPTDALERPHFDLVMPAVAVRNTVKYSETVLPPQRGARSDYEILTELAIRIATHTLGPAGPLVRRGLLRAVPSLERIIDTLLRVGPYGDRFLPGHSGLNLEKVRAAVHGIDLGPLVPQGREKVRTPDGRPNVAPDAIVAGVAHVERWLEVPRDGSLVLIGRRHLRSNNSWMHNCASLVKGKDRSGLLMSRVDAERRGLLDCEHVRVTGPHGDVQVRLDCTEDMMPGVVSLPHGFGHRVAASTMKIAGALGGANVNVLTDDQRVEPILGDSILNGVPVTVERA